MKNATNDCPVHADSAKEFELREMCPECARLHHALEREQQERKRLAKRYFELENKYASLARLHVAAERLMAPQSPSEVYTAIQEVVANLLGSEQVGVFRFDHQECNLRLVSSCGIDSEQLATVPLGSSLIGRTAATGKVFVAPGRRASGLAAGSVAIEETLTACIPLRRDPILLGAVAIFGLLEQNEGFDEEAIELLEAVAQWASIALYCTTIGAMVTKRKEAL